MRFLYILLLLQSIVLYKSWWVLGGWEVSADYHIIDVCGNQWFMGK